MTLSVRRLEPEDAEAARRPGMEAFGVPSSPPSSPATIDQPGRTWYGAFDGELLVAQLVDREYDSFFGGVPMPTCGVAGVTVAAEYRGQGLLDPLFADLLRNAKQRGALISTLFPSAPRIYRKFGYETIAEYLTVEVPSPSLASVSRATTVRTPGAQSRPTSTPSVRSTTPGRSSRTVRSAVEESRSLRPLRTSSPASLA